MKLQNTKHLINNHRLTVICTKNDEQVLLNKLLSSLNDNYTNSQSLDTLTDYKSVYVSKICELINLAEQNDTHLVATFLSNKGSTWRSIFFRIPEELKEEVCFAKLVNHEDIAEIRLEIESGENAWQYISYSLDDKGNINEVN